MNIPLWSAHKAKEEQDKAEWKARVAFWDTKIETVEGCMEFLDEYPQPLTGYAVRKILKTVCREMIALKKDSHPRQDL